MPLINAWRRESLVRRLPAGGLLQPLRKLTLHAQKGSR
jgi:hypothetical protein